MAEGRPRIGISMGDPAGVGPEVIARAVLDGELSTLCRMVVVGDPGIMRREVGKLSPASKVVRLESATETVAEGMVGVIPLTELENLAPGTITAAAGDAAARYIRHAAGLALTGEIDAMATGPISKESLNLAGCRYPGHTEFLAHLTDTNDYAMMLMGESLRVILLTTHCPLMAVAGRLSKEETLRIIRLADRSLRNDFGIAAPRLVLAGLNPHAGESGLFGTEEETILSPAVAAARAEGIDISGPEPSDTLFYRAVRKGAADAVICPYHDQGLIPLKLLHFDDGVNVTLGLPIVRTSPDHGTAFDIAGRGIANPASMKAAIRTAVSMAKSRRKHCPE